MMRPETAAMTMDRTMKEASIEHVRDLREAATQRLRDPRRRPHSARRYTTSLVASIAAHGLVALVLSFIVVTQREELGRVFSVDFVAVPTKEMKRRPIRRRPPVRPRTDVAMQTTPVRPNEWRIAETPPLPDRVETAVDLPAEPGSPLVARAAKLPRETLPLPVRAEVPLRSNFGGIQIDGTRPIQLEIAKPDQVMPGLSSLLMRNAGLNTEPTLLPEYWQAIQKRIEKNRRYPRFAREQGIEGTTTIRFTLHRDGSVSGVTVASSSGSTILDDAAKRTIERAAPFPPFPEGQLGEALTIQLDIVYRLDDG